MTVIVYTKNNCPPCNATKRFLNNNRIGFEERNTESDPVYREEALATGFLQTPIVVTSDDAWSGHNPTKLNRLRGDR